MRSFYRGIPPNSFLINRIERMQWICGIPQKQMTVLLDTSDKDPLHLHCYQVNDCQKSKYFLLVKGGLHFSTEKNAITFQ